MQSGKNFGPREWRCRIGAIKPKNGGAVVRVIDNTAVQGSPVRSLFSTALPIIDHGYEIGIPPAMCVSAIVWADGSMDVNYATEKPGEHAAVNYRMLAMTLEDLSRDLRVFSYCNQTSVATRYGELNGENYNASTDP